MRGESLLLDKYHNELGRSLPKALIFRIGFAYVPGAQDDGSLVLSKIGPMEIFWI
jgi:hypothetical protein